MTEKVGNVILDLTYYPGEDYYSDGTIEDELLTIAKEHTSEEFPQIIEEKKSWPVFYHLSPFRANIIDWLPVKKTDKVLEIGSGCGAITGSLARKAGSVTCIDLSKKRSLVNAYRNKEQDNITIMVGNFKDIEPHLASDYDYVFLIGVFEYGQAYIGGETPYEDFMQICNRHRASNGRMVIAIENKFGLKYWAGCREDHLGTFFSGLESYREGGAARTFTRKGLEKILEKSGISQYSFYYPYPDYKFMNCIYSDRYLPKKGELSNNLRNFDRDRILLFDEKQVFDAVLEEGEFPLFSNSYMLIAGKEPECVYTKFSNDRAKPWAIRTAIYENAFGDLHVEKVPDTRAAWGHLLNTAKAYELLSKRYAGTKIRMNTCTKKEASLSFTYCEGVTLEEMLDDCLARKDVAGFRKLVQEYMKWVSYHEGNVSNIDFVFSNIIINEDIWQVIDYEWTFEREIPAKEIAFRAFYNYMLGSEVRQECRQLFMEDILGLTEEEIEEYTKEEKEFQKYITGERAAVADMRELIGYKAYDVKVMEAYFASTVHKYVAQIYVDSGSGFSEEESFFLENCFQNEKNLSFEIIIPDNAKQIRIDPCAYACIINLGEIRIGDKLFQKKEMQINGGWLDEKCMVFATADPNISIACEGSDRQLSVAMEVIEISEELAKKLQPKEHMWKKRF